LLGGILFAADDIVIAGTDENFLDEGCVWIFWLGRSKEKLVGEELVEVWLEGVEKRTLCAVGVGGEERDRSR
jgi:hypothetical protein